MQDKFSLLSAFLTRAPSAVDHVDPEDQPMSYLVVPIAAELRNRADREINPDSSWYWFDFNTSTEQANSLEFQSGSLFDITFSTESENCFDGIILNLQLGWADFEQTFRLCHRWLKPGGKLYFSTFGPDTLFELREAWRQIDTFIHVHDFPDVHVLGDQLVKTGFEKPILDTDWQGVEFEDIDLLLSDLQKQGFGNCHQQRRRTLTGKSLFSKLRESFSDKPVQITFEIIYGYATVPQREPGSIHVNVPAFKN